MGKNPDSGGRPPNGAIMVRISIVMGGVLFHVCDSDPVVVHKLGINSKKTESVIVI